LLEEEMTLFLLGKEKAFTEKENKVIKMLLKREDILIVAIPLTFYLPIALVSLAVNRFPEYFTFSLLAFPIMIVGAFFEWYLRCKGSKVMDG
jgi:hypothetical protein